MNIDIETRETNPRLELSNASELLLPLRWIAILRGRLNTSLAHTSGIHSTEGLIKSLVAGADVSMVASQLYRGGISQIQRLRDAFASVPESQPRGAVVGAVGEALLTRHTTGPRLEKRDFQLVVSAGRPRQW